MLPIGYSKVTIDAVTKTRYHAVELDHPKDDDRKTLGENLGCQAFWCKHYISFGLDSESDDDMDDEDSHQNREPSISSPLRPKTHKTGPSTTLQLNHLRTCKKTHRQRNRYYPRLARLAHLLGLQLNHLRTCKKTQGQRKNF